MRSTGIEWKKRTSMARPKRAKKPKEWVDSPYRLVTILSCGDEIRLSPPPRQGDLVLCSRCDDYREVTNIEGWKVACRDCPMARNYGEQEGQCRSQAMRHSNIFHHDVGVFRGSRQAYVVYGTVTEP